MSTTLEGINPGSSTIHTSATTGPALVSGATSITTEAKPRRGRPRRPPEITPEQHDLIRALFTAIGKITPCDNITDFEALIRPTRQAIYDVTCWSMWRASSEAWNVIDDHVSAIPLEDRQRLRETSRRVLDRMGVLS
jgi:hypothetical protein